MKIKFLLSNAEPGRLVGRSCHLGHNNMPLSIIVAAGAEVLAVIELVLEGTHGGAGVRLIVAHVSHAFLAPAVARRANAIAAKEFGRQNGAASIVQPPAELFIERAQSQKHQPRRSSRAHQAVGCLLLHRSLQLVEVSRTLSTAHTHVSAHILIVV
jgi:hypothetical protein